MRVLLLPVTVLALAASSCGRDEQPMMPGTRHAADPPPVVPIVLRDSGGVCMAEQEPTVARPTVRRHQKLIWVITNYCTGQPKQVRIQVVRNVDTGDDITGDGPFDDDDAADDAPGRRAEIHPLRTGMIHVRVKQGPPPPHKPDDPVRITYKYNVYVDEGPPLDPEVIADWP